MKKIMVSVIIIAFLIISSASTIALLPVMESTTIQSEKNIADTETPLSDGTSRQISQSDVTTHDNVGNSSKQYEQALNQDESATWATVANQSQVSQPVVPLPDGRIFMRANTGIEDPIPYIPTEYPKTATPPIIPSELDI